MPGRDVTTIKDLIYYEYAKIIARSAVAVPDGTTAKRNFYGFIKQTYRELQTSYLLRDESYNVSNVPNFAVEE